MEYELGVGLGFVSKTKGSPVTGGGWGSSPPYSTNNTAGGFDLKSWVIQSVSENWGWEGEAPTWGEAVRDMKAKYDELAADKPGEMPDDLTWGVVEGPGTIDT